MAEQINTANPDYNWVDKDQKVIKDFKAFST
jgi:hypothetical protein